MIEGEKCTKRLGCYGKKLKTDISKKVKGSKPKERIYGSVTMEGSVYRDRICLTNGTDACVNNFTYFLIEKKTSLVKY